MILIYIISAFLFIGLVSIIQNKYFSKHLKQITDRIRFNRSYSKRLTILKTRIHKTDFNEIRSDLDNLNSIIQLQTKDCKNIKPHTLNEEQSELEKSFLSSNEIAKKILMSNETN